MAVPVFKFQSSNTGAQTLNLSFPQAPTAGDLILLIISYSGPGATVPSGYSHASRQTSKGSFFETVDIFWKIATASEPNVSISTSADFSCGSLVVYSGTSQTDPFDVIKQNTHNDNTNYTSSTAPGVTAPSSPNVAVLRLYGMCASSSTTPGVTGISPTSTTLRSSSARTYVGVYVYEDNPRDETNSYTATWNTQGAVVGQTVVIRDPNTRPNPATLSVPANASYQNLAAGFSFKYGFSDPNSQDTQASYAFRRKVSGGTYEYWNAGTAAFQSTEVFNSYTLSNNSEGTITFPSGKWTSGTTYQWSVSTRDNSGLTGAYPDDFTVTASTPPTVSVTAPTGTVSNTSRPDVTWTYSDAENSAQVTYRVKVFTQAQYQASGFTPSGSTAFWDSGVVSASATRTVKVGVDLTNNTTFRAYVQATQIGGQASAWAFSEFTVSITPPAAPTLTTDYDRLNNRIVLTVKGNNTSGTYTTSNTWHVVERLSMDGVTWTAVRGATNIPGAGGTVFDYEAVNGSRQYRAITRGNV